MATRLSFTTCKVWRHLLCLPLGLLAVLGVGVARGSAAELTCSTKAIEFRDPFAGWQLLVSEGSRDVTREVQYVSSNPAARVDARGYVTPAGDGLASMHILGEKAQVEVPVRVSGFRSGRPVDFKTEIEPLFSRLGCNAGGCHGKASGQNGFKLSLFGFDAAFDHEAITPDWPSIP